jgi:hypothetical protein
LLTPHRIVAVLCGFITACYRAIVVAFAVVIQRWKSWGVWAFVMVSASSRHMFFRPVLSINALSWAETHFAAIAFAERSLNDDQEMSYAATDHRFHPPCGLFAGTTSASAQQPSSPPTTGSLGQAPPPATEAPLPSTARVAAPTDPVLLDDPLSYWLLDDPPADGAFDSVRPPRTPHPGTYTPGVVVAASNPTRGLNGARQFPGGACEGVVVNPSAIQVPNALTVEGWVRTTASTGIILRWRWFGYLLRVSNNRAEFSVSIAGTGGGFVGGPVLAGTSIVSDGRWHHIAGVRTATNPAKLQLYVDGQLDSETTIGSAPSNFYGLPREAAIGRDGNACDGAIPSMNGAVAAVAVFDKALDVDAIRRHARVDIEPTEVVPNDLQPLAAAGTVRSRTDEFCLDAPRGQGPGANASQWRCHFLDNQNWQLLRSQSSAAPLDAPYSGLFALRNVETGLCLERNPDVVLTVCAPSSLQRWRLKRVQLLPHLNGLYSDPYVIAPYGATDSRCLTVVDGVIQPARNRATLAVAPCEVQGSPTLAGPFNQQWLFDHQLGIPNVDPVSPIPPPLRPWSIQSRNQPHFDRQGAVRSANSQALVAAYSGIFEPFEPLTNILPDPPIPARAINDCTLFVSSAWHLGGKIPMNSGWYTRQTELLPPSLVVERSSSFQLGSAFYKFWEPTPDAIVSSVLTEAQTKANFSGGKPGDVLLWNWNDDSRVFDHTTMLVNPKTPGPGTYVDTFDNNYAYRISWGDQMAQRGGAPRVNAPWNIAYYIKKKHYQPIPTVRVLSWKGAERS